MVTGRAPARLPVDYEMLLAQLQRGLDDQREVRVKS
jgi:hypothetical protein